MTPEMRQALINVGEDRQFAAGDVLRAKGAYASDLLLILEGHVDCILSDDETNALTLGPDSVVGEIGFLTGQAANATLRATDDVRALSLDAAALATLRQGAPEIAADVLRHLARLMQARVESNKEQMDEAPPSSTSGLDIVRCSTLDQLRTAQRLRYDVQCLDHGRSSAEADHDEKLIWDEFDTTGTTFLAYQGARPVGTLRVNVGQHSDFDVLTQLYGMDQSGDGAKEWAFVSRIAIRDLPDAPDTLTQLVAAGRLALEETEAHVAFVDCPPSVIRVFEASGFVRSAPDFLHAENGISTPMKLILD